MTLFIFFALLFLIALAIIDKELAASVIKFVIGLIAMLAFLVVIVITVHMIGAPT